MDSIPEPWELALESTRTTWTDGDVTHNGLAIRDERRPDAFVCSTVFVELDEHN